MNGAIGGGYLRSLHHKARWTELPLSFIQLILAISEIPRSLNSSPTISHGGKCLVHSLSFTSLAIPTHFPHSPPIRRITLEVYMNCSCLFRCHVAVAELFISCCSRPKGWFLLRVMEVNWDWVPKWPKQRNQCLGCFWRSHEHWEVFSRWCGG